MLTDEPDDTEWEVILQAIHAAIGGEAFTIAQLWAELNVNGDGTRTPAGQQLYEALPPRLRESSRALGQAFRHNRGRRFGKSQIYIDNEGRDGHTKAALWRVFPGD
jgi:hypothetical protein